MDEVTSGSCQCGAVRFRIEGRLTHFFLCHCSRCRKDTGSAHAANLFGGDAALTWLAGEESVRRYRIPGTRHEKSFCATCGTPLPLREEGGWLMVPAGSLDSAIALRPEAHICWDSRANWDEHLEDVPRRDGVPD